MIPIENFYKVLFFLVLIISLAYPTKSSAFDDPSGMQFDIGEGVPQSEIDKISQGIARVRSYLDKALGGDIGQIYREASIVRIVATGEGNTEDGGGGGCCTAFSSSNPDAGRIFLDVLHPIWLTSTLINQLHHASHEYTHIWQGSLGCISPSTHPLGAWLNEGIAEYVTWSAFIDQGLITREQAHQDQYDAAAIDQLDYPLEDFSGVVANVWPGHIGFLAVAELVTIAPDGELSIRQICERVTSGETIEDAFLNSFGISPADFAVQFEPSPIPPSKPPPPRQPRKGHIAIIIQLLLGE